MLPIPRTRVRTRTIAEQVSKPALVSKSELLTITIEYVPPADLVPSKTKLRKHTEQQIEFLVGGIQKFGFVLPLLVAKLNKLIDGEAMLEAAKRIGMGKVPIVRLEDIGDADARALRILLNQLPTLSSWDEALLKAEIEFLSSVSIELPTFLGFDTAQLDILTSTPATEDGDLEATGSLPPLDAVVSLPGDIWIFQGGHRLGCLDARNEASFARLMEKAKAAVTISDPPYNVPIKGHVTSRADAHEFAMASGEMSPAEFTEFLATSFRNSAAHALDGSLSFQFMDWRHTSEMMAAGQQTYGPLFNLVVWAKTNPGMGSPWRSGHELCFVWKKRGAAHLDNVRLGRVGRNRSNVWTYPGANQHRDCGSEGHVTPKNLAMIQDAILDVSNRGDIVLDAFAGSGTTLVAAHLAGRRGFGLEIEPAYVDLAVRRLETRTKAPARHHETGRTFAETAADRGVHLSSAKSAR